MERLAPREDVQFHNYINKPSIIRAQLAPKPPSRDVSFSNYLQTEASNHPVLCAQDSEISIFDAEKYFNGAHDPNSKKNTNEVYTIPSPKQPDIPTIRRLSLSTPKQSVSSVSRISSVSEESYGRNYRARSFHATPTASSEASWNSQTGLLTNPPGLAPVSIRNIQTAGDRTSKKPGASTNWFLRGNICPCTGRKSVNVKESSNSESETGKIPSPTPPRIVQLNRISSSAGSGGYLYSSSQSSPSSARGALIPDQPVRSFIARPQLDQTKLIMTSTNPNLANLHRDQSFLPNRTAVGAGNGFTFPILSEKAAQSKRTANIAQPNVLEDDAGETPRDSIEVFQPRESPRSRRASYDDDGCSDASSDLFEIESFSTTTATQTFPFPRRDSLDDPAANFNVRRLRIAACNKAASSSVAIAGLAEDDVDEPLTPSIAPTECYPPSEVSVDWSVTTAEGFDRASLAGFSVSASEIGYAALRKPPKFGSGADESKRKGNGGLLTSCRCEKAVNVGPAPIKYQTETRPANTTRSHGNNTKSQAPIRVNGASNTDNNGSHSHGVPKPPSRSTLMPLPFVAESLAHRNSL